MFWSVALAEFYSEKDIKKMTEFAEAAELFAREKSV